jgi:hypothetical protein
MYVQHEPENRVCQRIGSCETDFAISVRPLNETLRNCLQRRLKARADVSSSHLNKHSLINSLAAQLDETCPYHVNAQAVLPPKISPLLPGSHLGHTEDGLQALAEAHILVEQKEERYWEAEVCRLRGILLLRQTGTPQAEAEAWLQRALDIARRQAAKSLELRAAMSLSRLWQQQGQRAASFP